MSDYDSMQILEALLKDKKREDDSIHFVLLKQISQAVVEELPIDIVRKISI
jgi:3-dehydroquinate synthetase